MPATWKDTDREELYQSLKSVVVLPTTQLRKPGSAWEPHTPAVLAEFWLPPEGTPTRHLRQSVNAVSSDSVNVFYLQVYSTGLSPFQIQRRPPARI